MLRPIRPEANAQYSDARWVIQAPLGRITRRSNSRILLLFPEPTKNQRPRSTARFLVESEGGVKRKTQQSYPHPRPAKMPGKSPIDGTFAQADNIRVGAPQTPGIPKMLRLASKLCST